MSALCFLASVDRCTITDGVWCVPTLALLQKVQAKMPVNTLPTSTHSCAVANRVGPNPILAHHLQESECMLPLGSFLASTNYCAEADDVWCRSKLALPQEVQPKLSMPPLLTSTCSCAVAHNVKPKPLHTHHPQEMKHTLPLHSFLASACHCMVTDGVRHHQPILALLHELQCKLPTAATGHHSCKH